MNSQKRLHGSVTVAPGPSLTFLGAAGMVSGSRHLVDTGAARVLVDCGLFQGEKELRERNWEPFPVPADSIDAVVLTHGHIDHSGWLPRLAREGFKGRILTSHATADLLGLLLYDSAKCQAEDAAYANRKGYSKHRPALPLYEERDVDRVLRLLEPVDRGAWFEPCRAARCRFHDAGHMLGSSFVEMEIATAVGALAHEIVARRGGDGIVVERRVEPADVAGKHDPPRPAGGRDLHL
ncbi:MAG: MBL fold metallo-hydrolase, partial [Planctomycetia bacterium]